MKRVPAAARIALSYVRVRKVRDIAGLYFTPPERPWFIDEKSRIQVLDSTQPLLPMRPGQVEGHGIISRRRV